jgi:hypothetical protein
MDDSTGKGKMFSMRERNQVRTSLQAAAADQQSRTGTAVLAVQTTGRLNCSTRSHQEVLLLAI